MVALQDAPGILGLARAMRRAPRVTLVQVFSHSSNARGLLSFIGPILALCLSLITRPSLLVGFMLVALTGGRRRAFALFLVIRSRLVRVTRVLGIHLIRSIVLTWLQLS